MRITFLLFHASLISDKRLRIYVFILNNGSSTTTEKERGAMWWRRRWFCRQFLSQQRLYILFREVQGLLYVHVSEEISPPWLIDKKEEAYICIVYFLRKNYFVFCILMASYCQIIVSVLSHTITKIRGLLATVCGQQGSILLSDQGLLYAMRSKPKGGTAVYSS